MSKICVDIYISIYMHKYAFAKYQILAIYNIILYMYFMGVIFLYNSVFIIYRFYCITVNNLLNIFSILHVVHIYIVIVFVCRRIWLLIMLNHSHRKSNILYNVIYILKYDEFVERKYDILRYNILRYDILYKIPLHILFI